MKFFKDYTLHWWEFGLLKVSLIALGVLAGAHWHNILSGKGITILLGAVFVLPSIYLIIVSLKQAKS
jgi:hypothetical protein